MFRPVRHGGTGAKSAVSDCISSSMVQNIPLYFSTRFKHETTEIGESTVPATSGLSRRIFWSWLRGKVRTRGPPGQLRLWSYHHHFCYNVASIRLPHCFLGGLHLLHTQMTEAFLPRDAMLARYMLPCRICVCPSVHPSVCPSQDGIVPKRPNAEQDHANNVVR